MTQASIQALNGLRDLHTLKWYVIPMLAVIFYIYVKEIRKSRKSGNWDAIIAGVTLFGMDFFNETWNGLVLHFTNYSALWTAPGETALRMMVGWNIEIMFMFAISGIIYYHSCSDKKDERILGIPNQWFWAIGYSVISVVVECLLNMGGLLVWAYPFWNLSFGGIWLIFLFGYFEFYVAIILVLKLKKMRDKLISVGIIYTLPVVANIVCQGLLGWKY